MRKKKEKAPMFEGLSWQDEDLAKMWTEVDKIGRGYGLTYIEPLLEIVTPSQLIDYLSYHGLPSGYNHWSFGKHNCTDHGNYANGRSGTTYEVILNTDKPIAYIVENNSLAMQLLVLAHACVGHADFFKNNYLFKKYTKPGEIVDFCHHAQSYVKDCEEKLGVTRVEEILNSAHALQNHGVDKYKHVRGTLSSFVQDKYDARYEHNISTRDPMLRGVQQTAEIPNIWYHDETQPHEFPEENLLYFIETYSKALNPLEKGLVRIVRYLANYFYPQVRTKVMNEGWASFWHHTIMHDLHKQGLESDGILIEQLDSHCGVINQPEGKHLNPYTLGFSIFRDIKRICENPTPEDLKHFPQLKGENWLEVLKDIRDNYKDSTFIAQWLSPKVARDLKLYVLNNDAQNTKHYTINAVSDDESFHQLKDALAKSYDMVSYYPDIRIKTVDGSRVLLMYNQYNDRGLEESEKHITCNHFGRLWGSNPEFVLSNLNH